MRRTTRGTTDPQTALQARDARYRTLVDSIDEGFCVIELVFDGERPVDYTFVETNRTFEEQTGLVGAVGRSARELVPDLEPHWFELYGAVAATGESARFTQGSEAMGRWFDVYAFRIGVPEDRQVGILFTDITARKEAEEAARLVADRDRFLAQLGDAIRSLSDPAEIQLAAMQVLGHHLDVLRAQYWEVEPDEEHVVSAGGFSAGVPLVGQRLCIDDFGSFVKDTNRAGRTLVVTDTSSDSRIGAPERAAYEARGVGAFVSLPLVKDGRLVACLGLNSAGPRVWSSEEIALAEDVAGQTWAAVERARAERALHVSEERLRLASEAAGIGSFIWHPAEDRGEPDERMLALFGLPPDGTLDLATALAQLIHTDDGEAYAAQVERAIDPAGDGHLSAEIRVIRPDGSKRCLAISGQTFFEGEPRRAVRMAGTAMDITAQKTVEERQAFLLELNDALRSLSDPLEIQDAALRALGERLGVDRVFYSEIDEARDEYVITRNYLSDNTPPLLGTFRLSDIRWTAELAGSGQVVVVEDASVDPRLSDRERESYGAMSMAAGIGVPLVKGERWVVGLGVHQQTPRTWTDAEVELVRETAERTWAAVERAKAERDHERFAAIAERAQDFVGICTPDLVPIYVNPAGLQTVGLDGLDEARRTPVPEFFFPEDQTMIRDEFLPRILREGSGEIEVRFRHFQTGEPIWMTYGVVALKDAEGRLTGFATVSRNVSDRRAMEQVIRDSEERFRSLANAAPAVIWTAAPSGSMTFQNARWIEYTGLALDEGVADWPSEVLHPEDVERFTEAWMHALATGEDLEIEARQRRVDGEHRWFLTRATAQRDSEGRIVQWLGSAADVHEAKQLEERLREREASERRARESAELLTAIVSELEAVQGMDRRARTLVELLVPAVFDYASVSFPSSKDGLVWAGAGEPSIVLALPIGAEPEASLALGRTAAPGDELSDGETTLAYAIAERAALLLGNARLREEEHRTALRLQRALLPNEVLRHPSVDIAARYEAGSDVLEVGGDWYDSFALEEGRIGIAVGDVVGHGLDAAASMGRMRTALAALASHSKSPSDVLGRLDEFALGPNGIDFATACYAVLDPATGELRYASAGHPPMLVVDAAGESRWLEDGRSLPLGVMHGNGREEASTVLEPGSLLVLYSDGLVERPRERLTAGLARLRELTVELRDAPLESMCERLISGMGVAEISSDDAVAMCVRLAVVPAGSFRATYPARPEELRRIRADVRGWLERRGVEGREQGDVLLVVGEACANAVEHAYSGRPGSLEVELEPDALLDGVLVRVRDFGSWREGSSRRENRGRGTTIMETLSTEFTRDAGAGGTLVTLRLPASNGASA